MLWFLPNGFLLAAVLFGALFLYRKSANQKGKAPFLLQTAALSEYILVGAGFLLINDLRRAIGAVAIVLAARIFCMAMLDDSFFAYILTLVIYSWLIYKMCYLRIRQYDFPSKFSFSQYVPLNDTYMREFIAESFTYADKQPQTVRQVAKDLRAKDKKRTQQQATSVAQSTVTVNVVSQKQQAEANRAVTKQAASSAKIQKQTAPKATNVNTAPKQPVALKKETPVQALRETSLVPLHVNTIRETIQDEAISTPRTTVLEKQELDERRTKQTVREKLDS